jgi:hypothetical protein
MEENIRGLLLVIITALGVWYQHLLPDQKKNEESDLTDGNNGGN